MSNEPAKVEFREKILAFQEGLIGLVESGQMKSIFDSEYRLIHHFTPIDPKYGCCAYAREMFVPKGYVIVGKIHKHAHLNFLMKGKMSVASENGTQIVEAPMIMVSQPGIKRAGYALEDSIWVTVHLTEHVGEEHLEEIEEEVIAKNYEELGLISSAAELSRLE